MTKFECWWPDECPRGESDPLLIDSLDYETAAEEAADWDMDFADGWERQGSDQVIAVRGEDGVVKTFKVSTEWNPSFGAMEIAKEGEQDG